MTTSPAALKKELTKTFKGTQFSITTTSHHLVYLEWRLEIGTNATVEAVLEILKKHETSVHYGSSIDNTIRSTGLIIVLRPKYTEEREAQAIKAVQEINPDSKWNQKWKRFDLAIMDQSEDYKATK